MALPLHLAEQLETCRLRKPERVTDRGVRRTQHYDLGGGQAWSQSFSAASKNELGWSTGAHGLRHSYAQDRLDEAKGRPWACLRPGDGEPRARALQAGHNEGVSAMTLLFLLVILVVLVVA